MREYKSHKTLTIKVRLLYFLIDCDDVFPNETSHEPMDI